MEPASCPFPVTAIAKPCRPGLLPRLSSTKSRTTGSPAFSDSWIRFQALAEDCTSLINQETGTFTFSSNSAMSTFSGVMGAE